MSVAVLTMASTMDAVWDNTTRPNYSLPRDIYTASWAVEITEGGQKMADKIARQYGFNNLGEVIQLVDQQKLFWCLSLSSWMDWRIFTTSS